MNKSKIVYEIQTRKLTILMMALKTVIEMDGCNIPHLRSQAHHNKVDSSKDVPRCFNKSD